MSKDPLACFSEPTRAWFAGCFGQPTQVQGEAWQAISSGSHTLVVAPTGSGKTLAAFLWALDQLAVEPGSGTRVLYISPLKALGVDIERNLRIPLRGIAEAAAELELPVPQVSVGIRSGDTSPSERAALRRRPPDVLITTPESLYLLLTSGARETLRGVTSVIIDEIHAVADSKRGTHLALSLERLTDLCLAPPQRIALSATVRPAERVAQFLGGGNKVRVVCPPSTKTWDLKLQLPEPAPADTGNWPQLENAIYESTLQPGSTLVFANSRRQAERLAGRLNELWASQQAPDTLHPSQDALPAQLMGSHDEIGAAPARFARSHHGSISKQVRAEVEEALKRGELRCVVATSSLELGIDMGAVARVIQVGAPPSVMSALQRIGRAGHEVGATSCGELYPTHRGELAASLVVTERLLTGAIEELQVPANPLDVLAQQTVAAAVASGDAGLCVTSWWSTVRRAMPYETLSREAFEAVLELLTGSYPSADFSELRARLQLRDDRLFPRPGSARLAVTSGGTIPDRGLFGVFTLESEGGSRRVGELDEEMVYETRLKDAITLGASTWQVEEITRDRVLVSPAPGRPGRLPFWHGETAGRPVELGRAIGTLHREALLAPDRLNHPMLEAATGEQLIGLLRAQQEATGVVPDDRTIVLERFRDEAGDWCFVLHSTLGRRLLAAWALAIGRSISQAGPFEVSPTAFDDGIIWRLPESQLADLMADLVIFDPDWARTAVAETLGASPLFAARFRECAARALLLPRRDPGKRTPLWQQRLKAHQLLEVAREHPRFPIVVETMREVLNDVLDLPAVCELLHELQTRAVRLVSVTTSQPSPMAAALLFYYAGTAVYETDAPLAERQHATLSIAPELLASVLGTLDLRGFLSLDVIADVETELQCRSAGSLARDPGEVVDLVRRLGPIEVSCLADHLLPGLGDDLALAQLAPEATVVELAGKPQLVAASELGLLHAALGIGQAQPEIPEGPGALSQLLGRYARTHGPFTAEQAAAAFGIGPGPTRGELDRLVASGKLTRGRFRETENLPEYVDPQVLQRIRRRCLANARNSLAPVPPGHYASFLLDWHQIGAGTDSTPEEVLAVLQRLAGSFLPASSWEAHVLPSRLSNYRSQHLDELVAEGEVLLRVRPGPSPTDPLLALVPRDDADLLPPGASHPAAEAYLSGKFPTASELWEAALAGALAPISMSQVRSHLALKGRHRLVRRPRRGRIRPARIRLSPQYQTAAHEQGRWYATPKEPVTPELGLLAQISARLECYGVLTRAVTEDLPGGFAAAYRLLSDLEDAGKVIRGYLIEGLGASQFATPSLIDSLREHSPKSSSPVVVLAATDPANPFGAILPWLGEHAAGLSRAAGALVVLRGGTLLAHLTRGGRQLKLFDDPDLPLPKLAFEVTSALLAAAQEGRIARIRVERLGNAPIGNDEIAQAMQRAGALLHPKGLTIG